MPHTLRRDMDDLELRILVAGVLVVLAILASKISSRLGIPVVLVFLAIGMLAGEDGPGNIAFDDYDTARAVGIVALAYILFAGGFDTRWNEVRPRVASAASLATIGVLVTAGVTGAFAAWVLDVSVKQGLLLGAIVSSTDAAAVFAVLRGRAVAVPGRVRSLLELESGGNDPMAVFLTVGLLDLLTEEHTSIALMITHFVVEMALGFVLGFAGGRLAARVVNRLRLDHDGLYPVVTMAVVALVYGGTALIGGSGFLAVYVAGLVLGNTALVHRRSLMHFHDALAWLMQIGMFLVLGLLVFPSDLPDVAGRALAITAVLVFVARPAAVFTSLAASRIGVRDRALVSWLGLRGAVPIVLATFPEAEGLAGAQTIFHIVFFVVVTSVLAQGTTVGAVTRALRVTPDPQDATPALGASADTVVADALQELAITESSPAVGRSLVALGLPPGVLVVLIARGPERFVPQGTTLIRAGDRLLVLAEDHAVAAARALLSGE
jgi:cell volume regulation protein A